MAAQRAGMGNYNRGLKREVEIDAPAARIKPPKLFDSQLEEDDEEWKWLYSRVREGEIP